MRSYKAASTSGLSPQALRLVELVYDEGKSLSQVLQENPDLMSGLDEYHKWHGEKHAAISTKSEKPDTGHSVKDAAKKLKKK